MFSALVKFVFKQALEEAIDYIEYQLLAKTNEAIVGKFRKIGTAFGRVYTVTVTSNFGGKALPPEGHPRAVHLRTIDAGMVDYHIWLVSFPRKKWEELSSELKF